ncbi:hypothetical protein Aperf_G00000001520 [Anoplocephala perfoliata]
MLRRGGGERGSSKKVSIVENEVDVNLRRLQEDILKQIRNRSAFPLRKVKRDGPESSFDPVCSKQRHISEAPTSSGQRRHSPFIRTDSIFDESLSDSNSFPLPSPPLPSPPPLEAPPVIEPKKPLTDSVKSSHPKPHFKNFDHYHEEVIEKSNPGCKLHSKSVFKAPSLHWNPTRGIIRRSHSMVHPCSSIKILCDNEDPLDSPIRPLSPPLRYSPNEATFRSTLPRQVDVLNHEMELEEDSSPTGSDVDAAISKAENRKKQLKARSATLQRIRRPSGSIGRLLNIQDTPSSLVYSRPIQSRQPPVVKYCVSSYQDEEDLKRQEEKVKKEVPHVPLIRDSPKVFATRGVTPFRRISRFSTTSSLTSTSPTVGEIETTSSIEDDNNSTQRGKWIFPTRRSIFVEESRQAPCEFHSSQARKETLSSWVERAEPPHHYTGPWMFEGLSPRLPTPLRRSRK